MKANIKKIEIMDANEHAVKCQMVADRNSISKLSDKLVRCNVCGAIMDINQFPAFAGIKINK